MGMLVGQMTSLKSEVTLLRAEAQHHDQRTNDVDRQLKVWAPVGKVNFNSNTDVWAFLRKYKSQKFCCEPKQLWHTWDRPEEEALLSKRVSLAIRTLRTRAVEQARKHCTQEN